MASQKKNKLTQAWEDFKAFALKDNVISLTIGVIIGGALKGLIDSLVNNVFTPPIGFLTAKLDFNQLFFTLGKKQYETLAQAQADNAVVIQYGAVLNALFSFLIISLILYFVSKAVTRATKKKEKEEAKTTKKCPYCMSEINIKAKKCPFCTSSVK